MRLSRETIGPDIELYVDANGGYTAKQAIRVMGSAEDLDVRWLEEPVSSDDLAGLREVRRAVRADVAAGEYGHDLVYFRRMCEAGAVDCLQADASRCGGITEWQAHLDESGALTLEVELRHGEHRDLVLEISAGPLPDPVDAEQAWSATEAAWRSSVPDLAASLAPRDAQHAYALLRGLTTRDGGMVAAATLGLPEHARAGRNYDYRHAWIRDQCYAGIAAGTDQPQPLLDVAVAFTAARLLEHGDNLAPGYRTNGTPIPSQSTLNLPGYPGGADVVGNRVDGQFQLDTLGEILQLLATAARHDRLDSDAHRALHLAVDVIGRRWNEPDAGIWELDDDWWTHSRLAAVAGLRTAAAELPAREATRLSDLADTILATTTRRCLGADRIWRRSPHHEGTDASLLLPPVRGALPPSDPRTRATIEAVHRELTEDGYVYRFAHDNRPLGEAEGAFLLCGFQLALAHWHQGETARAYRWFERNRAACGPPGLLAEEYDVRQRQLRGNIPQAFVHAMLLEAAQRLAR